MSRRGRMAPRWRMAAVGAFLGAVLLAMSFPLPVSARFSVDRQRIHLTVKPGEEQVGSFRVRNHGHEPIPIRVTPVDYVRDDQGRVLTPSAGSTDSSLLPYVVLYPTEFTVEPGSYVDVQYVVNVPETFRGSRWIALLVRRADNQPSDMQDQGPADGVRVRFNFHVVYRTLLVVTAEGTEDFQGGVIDVRRLVGNDGTAFQVAVENRGNAMFRVGGRVEIRDETGATVATLPLKGLDILPGHTRRVTSTPQHLGLEPGTYLALAVVDFGGDYLTAGQLRFVVE